MPLNDEPAIRRLTDRAEILDVVGGYATALDTKDWTALASLFTEDATWEYTGGGERLTGPEAIVARIAAALRPLAVTQHLFGNHTVRVDGDEAEHACYVQAQHVAKDGRKYLGAGRYADRLHRTADGWRFTHRSLTSMWSDGDTAVVLG
ncbi:nuclear transport factor 2 family protein [Actinomadura roseirufa]|uniref:nuclear transport factor 2 family protein n=1 Tax=Actinomadura roseirufa TaxID=2094049 RepID=UPI001040E10D|nr:nuclear transport factor 2 family protein [Actinomadura roseirufa]